MNTSFSSTLQLASILERHRAGIQIQWADRLRQIDSSHYRGLKPADLQGATQRGVQTLIDALRSQEQSGQIDHQVIESYVVNVAMRRLEQGFDPAEVVQAMLLIKEVILPIVFAVHPFGSPESYQAILKLDTVLRSMVGRFSKHYADAANRSLQEKQERIEAMYAETRQRLEETQSLQRVTSALLQNLNPETVIDIVCREAQKLIGALGSTVFLLEGDDAQPFSPDRFDPVQQGGSPAPVDASEKDLATAQLRVAHSTGLGVPTFQRIRVSDSLLQDAILKGEIVLSNDPLNGPQGYQRDVPLSAVIGVPLRVKGHIIGTLDVVNKPGGFNENDIRLLSIYADQAAIAIENTRLNQQVEQIAVMEERNRLARELHDSVTQSLYGVTLYAEAATRMLQSGNNDTAAEYLGELRETAQEALREMRLLIFELRPPVLEKEGLLAALQMRLDSVEGRAGLQTELIQEIDDGYRLPAAVEQGLYRIAQEALNNSLKHAQAHKITIRLAQQDSRLILDIRDDGKGFNPAAVRRQGGLGLRGMQERAEQLNAKLSIKSRPGHGARIQVEVETCQPFAS